MADQLVWRLTGGGDEIAQASIGSGAYELWCTIGGYLLQFRVGGDVRLILPNELSRAKAKEAAQQDWNRICLEAGDRSPPAGSQSAAAHAAAQDGSASIKDRIAALVQKEREASDALDEARRAVREAEAERSSCPHEFAPPPKAYAHEGGTCRLCGINELYAHTLRRQSSGA